MATQELTSYTQECFEKQEEVFGNTNAKGVADAIAGNGNSSLHRLIERQVARMPTRPFLYEGVEETIKDLLALDDEVVIWTQGQESVQLHKVASSGIGKLRRVLPREKRHNLKVFTNPDKVSPLPSLINDFLEKGIKTIIIVDDKAENIVRASKKIEEAARDGYIDRETRIIPVWINQGHFQGQVPQGYTLEEFRKQFMTIEDTREIQTIRAQIEGKIGWLIDFDHTLVDTNAAKKILFEKMADSIMATSPTPTISHEIDREIGLNGNVKGIEELLSGMSGGRVIKIITDQRVIVVKHNPLQPRKIAQEIDGYDKLLNTPLADHLPRPIATLRQAGVIVLPFFEGIQLREGVRQNRLPLDVAQRTLAQLLSIKKEWWTKQPKIQVDEETTSMQRDEWQDTIKKLNASLLSLSQIFNIPVYNLWTSPIVIDGQEYPPLLAAVNKTATALRQPPPYALLSHGDATGANIVVSEEKNEWVLLDAEWAGPTDPAESYVRMIKYLSTTTVSEIYALDAKLQDGKIVIEMRLKFPQSAISLQQYGMTMLPVFARSLSDPYFPERVRDYLTGSYLRELALSLQRGKPELGLLAMIKAGEAQIR